MSYLSNQNTPLNLRTQAANAALAYVEAIAHEESMYCLMVTQGGYAYATIELMQSYNDAVIVRKEAHYIMECAARDIAKTAQ